MLTNDELMRIRDEANSILKAIGSHIKLCDPVRHKESAIQYRTATYTNAVVIIGNGGCGIGDPVILGILQVVDIHRPFKWLTSGLPGPNTKKIYHYADPVRSGAMRSGWC